jgi:hypothetical protein
VVRDFKQTVFKICYILYIKIQILCNGWVDAKAIMQKKAVAVVAVAVWH